MNVYNSTLTIEGAVLEGENPLPMFRNKNHHREVIVNESFTEEHKKLIGYETGDRYLPYRMKDRYSRDRKDIEIKTIILENEVLKAVFLPDYGGRLYSLLDKKTNKDILYKNPVLQPANLAIVNAWFSGGIEWNIGHVGHTFTTCSPVHAAKLLDDNGNEFLRIFEYERCKNIFWQIDFHLPGGAEQLQVYVRIVNDNNRSVPMYWWTNIAVEETAESRVFSSTSEVIYMDPKLKGFGIGNLPELPTLPDTDVSYPLNFSYASEYFYQTAETRSPWEAVAYADGKLFYERSTSLLRYRKMFCWGSHAGGRRWCDFLAKPGEGNYIEVQAGLAPTQLHGLDMLENSILDFTQIIGVSQIDTKLTYQKSWSEAREYVEAHVKVTLNEDEVYVIHENLQSYADLKPTEMLHLGSGWGALEQQRRKIKEDRSIPVGFLFAELKFESPQSPWMMLLNQGGLPEHDIHITPASWMIQDEWMQLLEESLEVNENQTWTAYLHYGVMLYEKGLDAEAIKAWEASIAIQPSAWVYRNLAVVMKERGELSMALAYMENAYAVSNQFPDRAFAEEYLLLLIQHKLFEKAWAIYEALPVEYAQSDRIQIIVGAAALELNKDVFMEKLFNTEFAIIREGEVLIIELWYKFNARKLAKAKNVELTKELLAEVMEVFPPPTNIDFRMMGA